MKKSTTSNLIRLFALITVFFLNHSYGYSQLTGNDKKVVNAFIKNIKEDNREAVATKVAYPFECEEGKSAIKNKEEFLSQYDEVFDETLKNMIIKSSISTDWANMGWRGIMFSTGVLWLNYDGFLIAINYDSKAEKEKNDKLLATEEITPVTDEKVKLHSSVSKFEKSITILQTHNYTIRIDDLGDGNYRYAAWEDGKKMNEKPSLVLLKGKLHYDGDAGNHAYIFKNGAYSYECYIIVAGDENNSSARLTVYRDDEEILTEEAKIITE